MSESTREYERCRRCKEMCRRRRIPEGAKLAPPRSGQPPVFKVGDWAYWCPNCKINFKITHFPPEATVNSN